MNILRLIHPFIPFASESIWQSLMPDYLMIEKYPNQAERELLKGLLNDYKKGNKMADFSLVQKIIVAIRDLRSSQKILAGQEIKAYIYSQKNQELLIDNTDLIKGLKTNLSELIILNKSEKIDKTIFINVEDCEIQLSINIDRAQELDRLKKEKENFETIIKNLEKKLTQEGFFEKAPPAIVMREKEKLREWQLELSKINDKIKEYDS